MENDLNTEGRPLKGFDHSLCHLGKYLLDNAKIISSNIQSVVSLLYTIPNLKEYKFDLAKNIRISETSKEQTLNYLENKLGQEVSEFNDKIYVISIPDSMLMKVLNLMIVGIRVNIIDCIISNGIQNIEQIAAYITDVHPSIGASEWLMPRLDNIIRGMLVSGILEIKPCNNSQ